MNFEIKNRWTGAVMFKAELSAEIVGNGYSLQLGFAVKKAVEAKADLRGANLRGANLGNANLRGADLGGADLGGADLGDAYLGGANLRGANLGNANLRGADLGGADLGGADLRGADLGNANLRGADLGGADLGDAYLGGANLRGADLESFKQDLIAEVLRMPNEIEALRDAIVAGKINGSSYSGECACLAGTLAKAHGEIDYSGKDLAIGDVTFHANANSPREVWFTAIRVGDTPDKNAAAAMALEWVNEAIAIRNLIRSVAP